jgi:predicted nuclease of predicted toxin-antitoxin system
MKFLLDVNLGGSLSEWLIDLGHDVVEVRHKNPRMEDDEI